MSNEKLNQSLNSIPVSHLNSLFLKKEIIYRGYIGKIIYIAHYLDLNPGPWVEVKLTIWNGRTVHKFMPLKDVVLVSKSSAA